MAEKSDAGRSLEQGRAEHRTISEQELEEILAEHRLWVKSGGRQGNRACLTGTSLRGASLEDVNLQEADLRGADLQDVNFRGANLAHAAFRGADLRGAILVGTRGLMDDRLVGTDLRKAELPEGIGEFQALTDVPGIAKHARNVFVILMVACAISWLTILQTTDVALLTNSSVTPLPFIQVEIPVTRFFLWASALLFLLYCYFHMYLRDYWMKLGSLPAFFPDGRALNECADLWILSPLVLSRVPLLKRQRTAHSARSLLFSVFAVWWLVPLTVIWFWLRHLPLRNWDVTLFQVVLAAFLAAFGVVSYSWAVHALQPRERDLQPPAEQGVLGHLKEQLLPSRSPNLLCLTLVFMFCFWDVSCRLRWVGPEWRDSRALSWAVLDLNGARLSVPSTEYGKWLRNGGKGKPPVQGAVLEHLNLQGAHAMRAFLVNADLTHCGLSYANLSMANLQGADLVGARLKGALLLTANFSQANLEGADLEGAELYQTNLKGAKLIWAYLKRAKLILANLSGVDLEGANLEGAKLYRATLIGASLKAANLKDAILFRANLSEANLEGANLTGANFYRADLRGVNFSKTNLERADLRRADLEGAVALTQEQLDRACGDEHTRLPDGLTVKRCQKKKQRRTIKR